MHKNLENKEIKFDDYEAIEDLVGAHSAEEVKKLFQVVTEKESWEMAIKVHIACGQRKDLEKEFPGWAGANPANHKWD